MRFIKHVRALAIVGGVLVSGAASLVAAPSGGHAHEHPTEGPHGGTLIELGKEDYHAELVHDEKTDAITVYILDASATAAVPITAPRLTLNMRVAGKPRQFHLAAAPRNGEGGGPSSAFATVDKQLGAALHAHGASGRLNVEIDGKMYVGKVGGHSHAHPH